MKKIPHFLIYSRLALGILLICFSLIQIGNYKTIAITFIIFGLLSDIFDGIIARRLNISTEKLRRLDSAIDQIFWLSITAATFIQCSSFFYTNYLLLFILIGTEIATYAICYIKFKKEVATHAISSKVWTLLIFACLIQVIATCDSTTLFQVCFYVGMLTRLEIIGILFLLKTWTNDVPSVYHAVLLRKGKPIKRNKLFNG